MKTKATWSNFYVRSHIIAFFINDPMLSFLSACTRSPFSVKNLFLFLSDYRAFYCGFWMFNHSTFNGSFLLFNGATFDRRKGHSMMPFLMDSLAILWCNFWHNFWPFLKQILPQLLPKFGCNLAQLRSIFYDRNIPELVSQFEHYVWQNFCPIVDGMLDTTFDYGVTQPITEID